ncbi:MAG: hypothetical protein IJ497_03600 [Clostridia bacterium]|nr:hypothetical protein [Clostridia bacterium]
MITPENDLLEFTSCASEILYETEDLLTENAENPAELIYSQLKNHMQSIPFSDYLKRYIYRKAGLSGGLCEVEFEEYRAILRDSFAENDVPPSFFPTTAKLSALTKNWLTQHTVRRSVVLLLGFGLRMSLEDVNEFLQKALLEPELYAKDPFEVLCGYCYRYGLNFAAFRRLWSAYLALPPSDAAFDLSSEETAGFKRKVSEITDEPSLMQYLAGLKTPDNEVVSHVTARKCFHALYSEAKDAAAAILGYPRTSESITESDIEHILYPAIPTDRYGNLVPSRNSTLGELFHDKRLCRQHIHDVLTGKLEPDRFDLITLSFFLHTQKDQLLPKRRYFRFADDANTMLALCGMNQLYPANPYESFLMMCLLTDDPLAVSSEVLELSYRGR